MIGKLPILGEKSPKERIQVVHNTPTLPSIDAFVSLSINSVSITSLLSLIFNLNSRAPTPPLPPLFQPILRTRAHPVDSFVNVKRS